MTTSTARQTIVGGGAADIAAGPQGIQDNHITVNVTIGSGARVGPYYPGPGCTSVWVAATGTATFQTNGSGDTGGLADDAFRDLQSGWGCKNPTATKAGNIDGLCLPWRFYLLDTSSTSNPTTIYFIYK